MISVIIPVYNEEAFIERTVTELKLRDLEELIGEIIVVDGGSTDDTAAKAAAAGARVVRSPVKGRAVQMNYGAGQATGDILYFLHADTLPPFGFTSAVAQAGTNGYAAGCFTLRFDHRHWFLNFNCWFTQFNVSAFHYGDASLYVSARLFAEVGGFAEDHIVFEDYQLVRRLKAKTSFFIIKQPVVTSARKYRVNGIFRMQLVFYAMYLLYRFRFSQEDLVTIYRKLIRQDKL